MREASFATVETIPSSCTPRGSLICSLVPLFSTHSFSSPPGFFFFCRWILQCVSVYQHVSLLFNFHLPYTLLYTILQCPSGIFPISIISLTSARTRCVAARYWPRYSPSNPWKASITKNSSIYFISFHSLFFYFIFYV